MSDKLQGSSQWHIVALDNQCLKLHGSRSLLGFKSLTGFKEVFCGLSSNHMNDSCITITTCGIILARLGLLRTWVGTFYHPES